jgi:hypothetical protein
LSKKLNLSSRLKPLNYFNELDKFISLHGNYNPVFNYKRPNVDILRKYEDDLKKLQDKTNKLSSNFKRLFLEKEDELLNRLCLIDAYSTQNFKNIEIYNQNLF